MAEIKRIFQPVSVNETLTASTGFVTAAETGVVGTPLVGYGVSTITASTSGATAAFTLAAPVAGQGKSIVCIGGSTSGGNATVTLAAGSTLKGATGSPTIATFSSQGFLTLHGVSASVYGIVGISTGSVALTS
jgi:hypothetical protein